jgi:Fe-S-cluster containining protein
MPRFECDKCGACCKGSLIVEADDLDVLREPRLIDADRHHVGKSVEQMVHEIQTDMKAIILVCGSACPFLGADNGCTIYPTRPNVCVGMQAGDEQCQEARAAEGLPPLLPVGEEHLPQGT